MIYATVAYPEDHSHVVDLTDDGWKVRAMDCPALQRLLNSAASIDDFGPADGDPVTRAAAIVAELLGGDVVSVRSPEPVPEDAVF